MNAPEIVAQCERFVLGLVSMVSPWTKLPGISTVLVVLYTFTGLCSMYSTVYAAGIAAK